jgi:hypothetical protein
VVCLEATFDHTVDGIPFWSLVVGLVYLFLGKNAPQFEETFVQIDKFVWRIIVIVHQLLEVGGGDLQAWNMNSQIRRLQRDGSACT